jgi:hypothetical protein
MYNRNNILALASLLAGMDSSMDTMSMRGRNTMTPEDIDVTPKKKPIPKGCKEFDIEGIKIIALNEKSAMKKFNKLNKHK